MVRRQQGLTLMSFVIVLVVVAFFALVVMKLFPMYSEYNNLADKDSNYKPHAGLKIVVPGGRREFISWRSPRTVRPGRAAPPRGAASSSASTGGTITAPL